MGNSIIVSKEEYEYLISQLNNFTTIKNNILAFSFTVSIALLAAAITANNLSPWICIGLFFLIIPFAARVSYYRLASAHINSFLKTFAPERMMFAIGTSTVLEKDGLSGVKKFKTIAWLVNHEMLMLSIAITTVFLYLLMVQTIVYDIYFYLRCCIPILLSIVVFLISNWTYSYKKLSDNYNQKWKDYFNQLLNSNQT
ncbi:hypothetical protein [Thomasclavelia cocleata]|uniref:hypothetical protein n=1 Tax=Thomasclavelia cocleata TaxID=69824 RepID=UPI00272D92E4|nr:hypothetical protein [Thomasclavelia cocleata]